MGILWKYNRQNRAITKNCAFPQNLHSRKLGELFVFKVVQVFLSVVKKGSAAVNLSNFEAYHLLKSGEIEPKKVIVKTRIC